jgi:hypothetical protein
MTATFFASLGIARWFQLGAALPASFVNHVESPANGATNSPGMGMLRFVPKFRLLREADHGLGLAVVTTLGVPSGGTSVFLGHDGVVFSPALLLEKAAGPVRFLLNVGGSVRETARYQSLTMGNDLFFRFGVGWRAHDNLELGAELLASTQVSSPFGSSSAGNPMEVLLGAKYFLGENVQFWLGAGPGLTTAPAAPSVRVFGGVVYAPHDPDTDGDGIPDRFDRCPKERGPRENQGCPVRKEAAPPPAPDPGPPPRTPAPAADRDQDGVPDRDEFASIKKVEVQGHTDDVGRRVSNVQLSQRRADAVRAYLIRRGVAPVRVDPEGMSQRELRAARAKNRRVQFVILEKGEAE